MYWRQNQNKTFKQTDDIDQRKEKKSLRMPGRLRNSVPTAVILMPINDNLIAVPKIKSCEYSKN